MACRWTALHACGVMRQTHARQRRLGLSKESQTGDPPPETGPLWHQTPLLHSSPQGHGGETWGVPAPQGGGAELGAQGGAQRWRPLRVVRPGGQLTLLPAPSGRCRHVAPTPPSASRGRTSAGEAVGIPAPFSPESRGSLKSARCVASRVRASELGSASARSPTCQLWGQGWAVCSSLQTPRASLPLFSVNYLLSCFQQINS